MNNFIKYVSSLLSRVECKCFGVEFTVLVEHDKIHNPKNIMLFGANVEPRVYIQIQYEAPCSKTKKQEKWKGRKWYLSEFMTDDEIIKTCYAAFDAAIKHEIMEGFKVDGIVLFNPHVNYETLLQVSHNEIKRN